MSTQISANNAKSPPKNHQSQHKSKQNKNEDKNKKENKKSESKLNPQAKEFAPARIVKRGDQPVIPKLLLKRNSPDVATEPSDKPAKYTGPVYKLCPIKFKGECAKAHYHSLPRKRKPAAEGPARRVFEKMKLSKFCSEGEVIECWLPPEICHDRFPMADHYHLHRMVRFAGTSDVSLKELMAEQILDSEMTTDEKDELEEDVMCNNTLWRSIMHNDGDANYFASTDEQNGLLADRLRDDRFDEYVLMNKAPREIVDLMSDDKPGTPDSLPDLTEDMETGSGYFEDVESVDHKSVVVYHNNPSVEEAKDEALVEFDLLNHVPEKSECIVPDEVSSVVKAARYKHIDNKVKGVVWFNKMIEHEKELGCFECVLHVITQYYRSIFYTSRERAPNRQLMDPDELIDAVRYRQVVPRNVKMVKEHNYLPGFLCRCMFGEEFSVLTEFQVDMLGNCYDYDMNVYIYENLFNELLKVAASFQVGGMKENKVASWTPARLFELTRGIDEQYFSFENYSTTMYTIIAIVNVITLKQQFMIASLPKVSVADIHMKARLDQHPRVVALDF